MGPNNDSTSHPTKQSQITAGGMKLQNKSYHP